MGKIVFSELCDKAGITFDHISTSGNAKLYSMVHHYDEKVSGSTQILRDEREKGDRVGIKEIGIG